MRGVLCGDQFTNLSFAHTKRGAPFSRHMHAPCSRDSRTQLHRLPRLVNQEGEDSANTTYSRMNLLTRDPSLTQHTQNTIRCRRRHGKRSVHRFRDGVCNLRMIMHAASCEQTDLPLTEGDVQQHALCCRSGSTVTSQAIARAPCAAMIHEHRHCRHDDHAASCPLAVVPCTLRMLHDCIDHVGIHSGVGCRSC